MQNNLHSFYWVYDEELRPKIYKIRNMINLDYMHSEAKADYVAIEVYGRALRAIGVNEIEFYGKNKKTKEKKVIDSYRYNIYLFRSEYARRLYLSNAPTKANRLIKEWERALNVPEEPYEEEVSRPIDMTLFPSVQPNTLYGPNKWIQIDKNSAEPYYVSEFIPYLKPKIEKLYNERKKKLINKNILVAINGNLRNSHLSIYLNVVNSLYNEMLDIAQKIDDAGGQSFALRRDAIIARVPDNFKLPDSIELGTELGQFKITQDYGTIQTTDSQINYITNMENIKTKLTGELAYSLLNEVYLVANKDLQIGLRFDKKNWRKNEKRK